MAFALMFLWLNRVNNLIAVPVLASILNYSKHAENVEQGLWETENGLKEYFVTNRLCLYGFIVEIINHYYHYY